MGAIDRLDLRPVVLARLGYRYDPACDWWRRPYWWRDGDSEAPIVLCDRDKTRLSFSNVPWTLP